MYASREARRAGIEAGAGRSAADLAADVQATAIAFAAEAASLPDEAWAAQVQGREDTPSCLLQPDGSGLGPFQIGPEQPTGQQVLVRGSPARLLAWLIGRDDGSGLRVSPDGAALPVLPSWR